jgi:hypothetical protein
MKVFELARKVGMKPKELLAELASHGIKSHLAIVPEEIVSGYLGVEKKTGEEPVARAVAPEPEVVGCPYTKEQVELGIRCLGNKAPQWQWRHILNG